MAQLHRQTQPCPPIVNGKVYVGSYQQLQIFGLLSTKSAAKKK